MHQLRDLPRADARSNDRAPDTAGCSPDAAAPDAAMPPAPRRSDRGTAGSRRSGREDRGCQALQPTESKRRRGLPRGGLSCLTHVRAKYPSRSARRTAHLTWHSIIRRVKQSTRTCHRLFTRPSSSRDSACLSSYLDHQRQITAICILTILRWRGAVMSHFDRRKFLQMIGGAAAMSAFESNINKALAILANNRTGTIQDVEHIVILMQENRPFDHHFGTLRGVRGYSDPRAVKINLPLKNGTGTTPASVFLQPAGGSNIHVPPDSVGGPSDGVDVVPPFRVNPNSVSPGLKNIGGTYLPGTGHGWSDIHNCWNQGQYDKWAIVHGSMAMN